MVQCTHTHTNIFKLKLTKGKSICAKLNGMACLKWRRRRCRHQISEEKNSSHQNEMNAKKYQQQQQRRQYIFFRSRHLWLLLLLFCWTFRNGK